jgi:hypothetical protein
LQRKLQKLEAEARKTGLKINVTKTKTLRNRNKAQQAFNQLGGIWKTNVVSTDIKVKMFNCTIDSLLFYGAETWKVGKETTYTL